MLMLDIKIPSGMQVDHINGIKDDDRLINLRLVTPSQNSRAHRDNYRDELPPNVTKAGKRYRVEIVIERKRYRPYFDTIKECVEFLYDFRNNLVPF